MKFGSHGISRLTILAIAVSCLSCSQTAEQAETGSAASDSAPEENTTSNLKQDILSAAWLQTKAGEASPPGRMLIGRGDDYVPIPGDPKVIFTDLEESMHLRRTTAWKIVEAMLEPQKITINGHEYNVPLWYTWYEGGEQGEIVIQLKKYFARLEACKADPSCAKTNDEIARETLRDTTTKNLETSLNSNNFDQILGQFQHLATGDGVLDAQAHLGQGFTVFSPTFVEHVLSQSSGIEGCKIGTPPDESPPSDSQFSPCIDEFPRSAVMVKTDWVKVDGPSDNPGSKATNPVALTPAIRDGTWPRASGQKPDTNNAYALRTKQNDTYVLRAIHFSTKDTREWIWITLWWSPEPNSDFGQDRPQERIARFNQGVWNNYKMCVTTSFNERDSRPNSSYESSHPSLAAALKSVHEEIGKQKAAAPYDKVTSWCSNPFLENHDGNARTNCIGCHQYSFTMNTKTGTRAEFDDTLERFDSIQYPQFGRSRKRANFPAEFSWAFGMEFRCNIAAAKGSTKPEGCRP